MYTLLFSKIIHEDVDSCYNYVKETLEAPRAAEDMIGELIKKLDYIKDTPFTRPLVQDKYLASLEIRSIKIKQYVLYYQIEKEKRIINIKREIG
jgi:mRNA-degrading endonuclease RelE of RelBE toxin-antitoxin system